MATDVDVAAIVEKAKYLLERRVTDPERPLDGAPSVVFWRGGRMVAEAHVRGNRDEALMVARAGVAGYGADMVAMVTEMFGVTKKWWADRNRVPKPGELQRVFDAGRTDLVTEALGVTWAKRGGGQFMVVLRYSLDSDTRRLTWSDGGVDGEVVPGVKGLIPDTLAATFERPDILALAAALGASAEAMGATPEQVRLRGDIATTRFLGSLGHLVMLVPASDDDLTVMRESFEADEGVSFYARSGDSYQKHGPAFEDWNP